jgi:hypothetical protein
LTVGFDCDVKSSNNSAAAICYEIPNSDNKKFLAEQVDQQDGFVATRLGSQVMSISKLTVHDGQQDCRSLRDAIFKVRGADDTGSFAAKVRTRLIRRPDGVLTGMIFVDAEINGERQLVRLPNCTHFKALTSDNQSVSLAVTDLHDGRLDQNGFVKLLDGRSLRNVTMKPGAPVMYDFGLLEDAIVRHTLMLLGVEHLCYREISPAHMSGVRVLDYSKICDIRLAHLKRLLPQIQRCFSTIPEARIKQALRRAGLRFPRSPRGVKAVTL